MPRMKKDESPHTITECVLDFQLPPPIYSSELTTLADRQHRTCKLVKSIVYDEGRVIITALEGNNYIVPMYKVRYMREE